MVCVFLEQQSQQQQETSPSSQDDTADASERRSALLAVGFAAVAMSLYALFTGLVQVEFSYKKDYDDLGESTPDMSAFTFREEQQNDQNTAG